MAKEVKGRVKQAAGKATRSARLQQEGKAEQARGRVRRAVGEAEADSEQAADF
jgi:uncharacterized protein YjbJ (UPF0337 family)